jgi:hypothetical protein
LSATKVLSVAAITDTLRGVVLTALGLRGAVRDASGGGAVAQLGERLVRNEEVSGSIPLSSTKESMNSIENLGTIRRKKAA